MYSGAYCNIAWAQISLNLVRPQHLCQVSNHFENLYRARQWYSCTLFKITNRFCKWMKNFRRVRFEFREIWVNWFSDGYRTIQQPPDPLIILSHYNDVMMSTMASQITSPTIVYSTVYSVTDERKHQSSASLPFVLMPSGNKLLPEPMLTQR